MIRRRRLGQHFLRSQDTARRMVEAAGIAGNETVLEIGPGRGIVTPHLCRRAGRVIAVEIDEGLYRGLRRSLRFGNLEIIHGDGFAAGVRFDVLVSSLPYSQSRRAVEWLSQQEFSRAVIVVQREFADKLTATLRNRRAVSVLASWAFEIETVCAAPRDGFDPPPEVDSVVMRITQRNRATAGLVSALNLLFSQRRKTVQSILKRLGSEGGDGRRLEEMPDEEIIRIARNIG